MYLLIISDLNAFAYCGQVNMTFLYRYEMV